MEALLDARGFAFTLSGETQGSREAERSAVLNGGRPFEPDPVNTGEGSCWPVLRAGLSARVLPALFVL